MPFLELNPDEVQLRSPLGSPVQSPLQPTPVDTMGAAFRLDNTLGSAFMRMKDQVNPPTPGYSPYDLEEFQGSKYEQHYLDNFLDDKSEADTRARMARIDREERDRETYEASGIFGFVAMGLAGVLDPTIFLPAGVVVRATRGGYHFGRSIASAGAAGSAAVGAMEVGLQATQETRTWEESVINIGSATVLACPLGVDAVADPLSIARRMQALDALGRGHEAAAMSADRARQSADEARAIAACGDVPGGVVLFPTAGDCMGSQFYEPGEFLAADTRCAVSPMHMAAFRRQGEPYCLAKLFLGVARHEDVCRVLFADNVAAPAAVLWMPNPSLLLGVGLDDLAFLAPVVGAVSTTRRYRALGSWAFSEAEAEALAPVLPVLDFCELAPVGELPHF